MTADRASHLTDDELRRAAARLGDAPYDIAARARASGDAADAHLSTCEACQERLFLGAEASASRVGALLAVASGPAYPPNAEEAARLDALTARGIERLRADGVLRPARAHRSRMRWLA